jgi:hypothetical protein
MVPAAVAQAGELLTQARAELLAHIAAAQTEIQLTSPFLTKAVASDLRKHALNAAARNRRLITALDERAVLVGVLDPTGLRQLLGAGWDVRTIPNLHAKLSLIDDSWGLVGSGNLTSAGLGGGPSGSNVELGVVLSPPQITKARTLFAQWWDWATPVSLRELAPYEDLARLTVPPERRLKRLGRPLPAAASTASRKPSGFWIKMMNDRPGEAEWWRHRRWIPDRHGWRNGKPTGRPSYAVGDRVALYHAGQRSIAALYQVTSEPKFDPKFASANGGNADRFAWVTLVEPLASTSVDQTLPASEIHLKGQSLRNGYKRISDPAIVGRIERHFEV